MTTETRREFWLDKPEKFYVYVVGLRDFMQMPGRPVQIPEASKADMFAVRGWPGWRPGEWFIVEGASGCRWNSDGGKSVKEAVRLARAELTDYCAGDCCRFAAAIRRNIDAVGLSPRYRWDEVVQDKGGGVG